MGKGIANWKRWLFDHEFYLAIGVSLTITSSSVDQFEVSADTDSDWKLNKSTTLLREAYQHLTSTNGIYGIIL